MNRLGLFLLNIAVSLYLFANGVLGITNTRNSGFYDLVNTIFRGAKDFNSVLTIILSVCAIVAGVFLLTTLFRNNLAVTDLILLVFIVLWVIFIILVDIVSPLKNAPALLDYLTRLSAHFMVLGALLSATKRFGYYV
jgi:ABC-type transport system involved in cytochrome bd biosynthesis fused ATPase/permease subunit